MIKNQVIALSAAQSMTCEYPAGHQVSAKQKTKYYYNIKRPQVHVQVATLEYFVC